jgi:hypothetical protein
MNNEPSLEQCKRLIETTLSWGEPASWSNEDFEDLSERIFQKTDVRLSVSTLKRIWGKVKYDHSPTTATLNALARFAGFAGWRDFQQQNSGSAAIEMASVDAAPFPPPSANPHGSPSIGPAAPLGFGRPSDFRPQSDFGGFLAPLIIGTLILAALLSLLSARFIHGTGPTPALRFDSRVTSDDLPNSVVFDYDAMPLHPKDVMIQQNWDIRRREKVSPNGNKHTSIYYYPGYFTAKLVVDGEIRKESEVFITTKGWKGIVGHSPLPVYLSTEEARDDSGHLGITARTLAVKTGSTVFSDTWTTFANVRAFPGLSGDHFTFRTTLRNTSTVEQCLCRNIRITILGKQSAIIIPLSDKGCIASLNVLTGFNALSGKDHDLSAFGCDFNDWQQVICSEDNHLLKITVNGRQALTLSNALAIGDIVGVRILFEGTGAIREAVLSGADTPIDLLSVPQYK